TELQQVFEVLAGYSDASVYQLRLATPFLYDLRLGILGLLLLVVAFGTQRLSEMLHLALAQLHLGMPRIRYFVSIWIRVSRRVGIGVEVPVQRRRVVDLAQYVVLGCEAPDFGVVESSFCVVQVRRLVPQVACEAEAVV